MFGNHAFSETPFASLRDELVVGFSLVPGSAEHLLTLVQFAIPESFSLTEPVYIDIAPEVYEQLPSHITPEPWVAVPY